MITNKYDDDFKALWSDPVTRRNLLRAAGVGAGMLTLGTVVSACDGSESEEAPDDPQPAGMGGTLPAAISFTFNTLDPTEGTFGALTITDFVYERLYRLDARLPRTEVSLELATEMPREISSTQYRISLREGVTFHNASPLTAEDVAFTINRGKDPELAPGLAQWLGVIDGVKTVAPNEIELELVAPTAYLVQRLALVKILSKKAVEASNEVLELEPIGSGPYEIVSAASGEHAVLEKFADYSGERDLGYDKLEVSVTLDANARLSGLFSGRFKIIEEAPVSALESLSSTEGVSVDGALGSTASYINFNCSKPPFDDPRVRQAVLYAIDRDAITKTSFFGEAVPAWSGIISPDHPEYTEPDIIYGYDPDKARRLLSEAGFANEPVPITFLFGSDADWLSSQVPIIEEGLKAVGFEPDLIGGLQPAMVGRAVEGDFNALLLRADGAALGNSDAEFMMRFVYYDGALQHWKGEPLLDFQQLLDSALHEPDSSVLASLLAKALNLVQHEVPIAPLHFRKQLTAWSDELEEVTPLPAPGLPLEGVRG